MLNRYYCYCNPNSYNVRQYLWHVGGEVVVRERSWFLQCLPQLRHQPSLTLLPSSLQYPTWRKNLFLPTLLLLSLLLLLLLLLLRPPHKETWCQILTGGTPGLDQETSRAVSGGKECVEESVVRVFPIASSGSQGVWENGPPARPSAPLTTHQEGKYRGGTCVYMSVFALPTYLI